MTIPLISLLGFATWTLLVLMATIGVHRWWHILAKGAAINAFPAHAPDGPDWYRRATRAHANCIENLPVFGAIVVVLTFAGVAGRVVDVLSLAVLIARVCQTTVHIAFVQTARAVGVRFSFFTVQLIAMLWMILLA